MYMTDPSENAKKNSYVTDTPDYASLEHNDYDIPNQSTSNNIKSQSQNEAQILENCSK